MKTPLGQKILTAYQAKVVIEEKLAKQIRHFVAKVPVECQWYTRVKREETDGEIVFTLYGDILIPPQKVGPKDVDMDPIGVAKMWQEYRKKLLDAGFSESDADAEQNTSMQESWNWCHSHVEMEIKPSKTDNEQWVDWVKLHDQNGTNSNPPMMMIINKKDEAFTRVYDPVTKIQFENISIEIEDSVDPDLDYVNSAVTEKLEKLEPPKKESIKPNPKYENYSTQSPARYGGQHHLWDSPGGSSNYPYGGGSQGLRGASGGAWSRPAGGSGTGTGGSSSNSFWVLNSKDIADLTTAWDLVESKAKKTREEGFKGIFRWIEKNLPVGGWQALYEMFCNPKTTEFEDYERALRLVGIHSKTEVPYAEVLVELGDLPDLETLLLVLDAILAFDAVGETEGFAALTDFLFELGEINDDPIEADELLLWGGPAPRMDPQEEQVYQVPKDCKFKVLP